MLYNIIIGPIEFILQIIFYICYGVTDNVIISLIGLSMAVSFLTLPLYYRADIYQQMERDKRRSMERGIKIIQKAFKGDERYWVLSAYYKEQNYKSIYALRSSLPILLQIPFFIAAYHFLTQMVVVSDILFEQADQWLRVGGHSINVLPILMTLINLLSGIVYSRELKWREKWQIFVLPIVFLMLLYHSPAGLVIYWIFNNLFSLAKNFVKEFHLEKQVKKICQVVFYIVGAFVFVYTVYLGCLNNDKELKIETATFILIALLLLYNVPLLFYLFMKERNIKSFEKIDRNVEFKEVILRETVLFLFSAIYIPIGVIAASPVEFLQSSVWESLTAIQYAVSVCLGLFFLWFNILYCMIDTKKKYYMRTVLTGLIILAIYDHFFWGNGNGLLLTNLRYEDGIQYAWQMILVSIVCFYAMIVVIYVILKFLSKWENKLVILGLFGLGFAVLFQMIGISINLKRERTEIAGNQEIQQLQEEGVFHLSREGKNVVVIMLDRAIGTYVPYIMDEKPELMEKFDGFTFYPNTVSTGASTHICSAELFGGYEYTPIELNKRANELLKDKQNEALKVLPILFRDNGYEIILSDLPYANYTLMGDMSIFDQYEHMTAYSLEQIYAQNDLTQKLSKQDQKRAFFEYAYYKTTPLFLQPFVYNHINNKYQKTGGGVNLAFYASYQVLDQLENITKIEDGSTNYFIEFDNNMTHEPCEWQLPEYKCKLIEPVDNSPYNASAPRIVNGRVMKLEREIQQIHYQTNMGAFLLLGEWLDYLRVEGAYDNTRIIIVADHGRELGQFDDLIMNDELDVESFNCLLLYKDFNSTGWNVCDDFMTNADVPTLAVQNLIEDAVNPFTGKKIDSSRKFEGPIEVTLSRKWEILPKSTFDTSDAPWYTVHDNIFIKENWELMK